MKKMTSMMLAGLLAMSFPMTAFAADEEAPGDVEVVNGEALNGAARITWEASTDNEEVTGYQVHYGLTPVEEVGQSFDEMINAGDTLSYVVNGLENDTEYFFAVVAYDAAGNESINWSPQVAVTPNGDASAAEDNEAPTVSSAEATNKFEVSVEFSEAVELPMEDAQDAFAIENDDTFEPLIVEDAVLDEDDDSGKTVILTTAEQEEGAFYTLTVGIDVADAAGNPIVSGTSDTAAFIGSGSEPMSEEEVSGMTEVLNVEAVDNTNIVVTFDRTIFLSIDPSEDFEITAVDDPTVVLEVLGVELGADENGTEDAVALITTSEQEDRQYKVVVYNVADEDGMEIEDNESLFRGVAIVETPIEDIIPPDDVATFLADTMLEAEKYAVKLTWEKVQSANADAVKQTIYQSTDEGGNYDKTADLDPEATEYEIKNLEAGEYWFKLTQTDAAGNESEGKVIKVSLSETGPEMAGLLLLSVGFGRMFRRKE